MAGRADLRLRRHRLRADRVAARIAHHDLCFGCGQANLFGLQMELERAGGGVAGRFFVKQDHQGPPGMAHGGLVGAALDEAMSLAVHSEDVYALTKEVQLHLHAPAPVGAFVQIEARVERREGKRLWTRATASSEEGERLAEATALFVKVAEPG